MTKTGRARYTLEFKQEAVRLVARYVHTGLTLEFVQHRALNIKEIPLQAFPLMQTCKLGK